LMAFVLSMLSSRVDKRILRLFSKTPALLKDPLSWSQ
jgi:hypothetical protein